MRRPGVFVLGAGLLAFLASHGAPSAPLSQSSLTDLSLQRAIDRGRTMYQYDRAAWVTSDDLVTRLPQQRGFEIGGWVVTETLGGLHVDYFGKDAAADHVIYSADVKGTTVSHPIVYPAGAEPMLKGSALQMARALRAAWIEMGRHPDWQPCALAHFNTIVLPPEPNGTVPVYFLTPQTQTDNFPFGGHYEVDIGAGGRTASTRAFTHSCIDMKKPPVGVGGKLAMMFITHLLDAEPTEIHVFEQYYVGIPVVVGIPNPRALWQVDDGTIVNVSNQLRQ